jgi:hypothetical protein
MIERTYHWKTILRTTGVLLASACLALTATTARAAVGFKTENGWGFSSDGFINVFAVDQVSDTPPAGVAADPLSPATKENTFRIRTGLLPGLIAFNLEAPEMDGLKLRSRVGFYPQIQNQAGNRVLPFGGQIDLREAFFTVDGSFGQILAGRALNLYQGKNILTDLTLFSVGVQGAAVGAGGTTAGRIGYGYVYTSFGAQFRYTTPDLSGLKLAVQVGDPNAIGGDLAAGGPVFAETRYPELESEISYSRKHGDLGVQAWLSGMWQKAYAATGDSATAVGGAGGIGMNAAGFDVLASGFYGKALGSFFMLSLDALDATGEERKGGGFLVQGAYTLGKTKLGLSYGQNVKKETAADVGTSQVDTRRSITGAVYHDVNAALKLVAEYTWSQTKWFGGADQATNTMALGAFLFW